MLLTGFEWTGKVEPWKRLQEEVRSKVVIEPLRPAPRFVAGVDCAFSRDGKLARAAAVVFDRHEQVIVDQAHLTVPCTAPYVPTYLTFREIPPVLQAMDRLRHAFDVIMVDGQGLAHPRRCGVGTHLGVLLDRPVVGCAKSRLIGTYDDLPEKVGGWSKLMDKEEVIGAVVRTRAGVKPLFVSIGHRVELQDAIDLVLACGRGYRLPEPTRVADKLSKFEKNATD